MVKWRSGIMQKNTLFTESILQLSKDQQWVISWMYIVQWGANKPQRSSDQHISASSDQNLKIKKRNESPWKDEEFATKRIKIGQAVWLWDGF